MTLQDFWNDLQFEMEGVQHNYQCPDRAVRNMSTKEEGPPDRAQ